MLEPVSVCTRVHIVVLVSSNGNSQYWCHSVLGLYNSSVLRQGAVASIYRRAFVVEGSVAAVAGRDRYAHVFCFCIATHIVSVLRRPPGYTAAVKPGSKSRPQRCCRPTVTERDVLLDLTSQELAEKQKAELEKLKLQDLSQYVIKGAESDWQQALGNGKLGKASVSVKRYSVHPEVVILLDLVTESTEAHRLPYFMRSASALKSSLVWGRAGVCCD